MLEAVDILTFFFSFVIFFIVLYFYAKFHRKDVFKRRLQDLMLYKERLLEKEIQEKTIYKREKKEGFQGFFQKLEIKGSEKEGNLKTKFDKAGIKSQNAMFVYIVFKMVFIIIAAMISSYIVFYYFHLDFFYQIGIIILGALLGSYSVDIILQMLIKARQDRIFNAFPDALDLMVICTEAGLSLTATIQRVAREISQISPDLGYELALLSIEINMLPNHRKALQNFSDRLDSPYFKSIISNISQAEEYGTPIAQTMRLIAEEFREKRVLKAEDKASRLPALLSLPMMLFIFPCIYLIILGPAIINVLQHFSE